jgi:hypothetical protein
VRELLPKQGTIAFVVNANSASTPYQIEEMQAAAHAIGQPLLIVSVGTDSPRRFGPRSVVKRLTPVGQPV